MTTLDRCPNCGSEDLQLWAEDGEADRADYWECARCKASGRLLVCEACEAVIDGPGGRQGIRVDEGGSIPPYAVCLDCLAIVRKLDPERAAYLIDSADIATGHDCLYHAVPAVGATPANAWRDCSVCGAVLEVSGDALVAP